MFSLLSSAFALVLVPASLVGAAGTYKLIWSTDIGGATFGPDGPWQAIQVSVGANDESGYTGGNTTFLWPSGTSTTNVLLKTAGGNYTAISATTPPETAANDTSNAGPGEPGVSDEWGSDYTLNETSIGEYVYDTLYFPSQSEDLELIRYGLNATIVALSEWDVFSPNGRNYTAPVGILGLGPSPIASAYDLSPPPSSLLGQMKENGTIASLFCGLHMGSALLGQSGSMVLGGYEQNRVLGDVGTFDLLTSENQGPQAFLLDVFLGVETGASPFNQSNNISLWHSIDDQGASQSQAAGGKTGSRLVSINPSAPYMYMPVGICETAAQYLPLTWDEGLGLYTWFMGSQYTRVVGSPAFMAIVLADNGAKNITIKVPFQLLNLTLLPPIVDTPTQYFPCRPMNSSTPFMLGRAFLQAAFLGFEYEHNLTFIAQGPGPDMEQSIIKTYEPADTNVTANALGTFASSWASSWTVLDVNHTTSTSSSNATSTSQPTSPSPSPSPGGLSGGAIAGAVVGSVLGVLVIVTVTIVLWRKKKRTGEDVKAGTYNITQAPPPSDQAMGTSAHPSELNHWAKPSEAYGNAPPHEMVVEERVHEAPHQME